MRMERIWHGSAALGEGPLWDVRSGELLWVDVEDGVVHRHDPSTDRHAATNGFDAPSALAIHPDGWIVATARGIELLRRGEVRAELLLAARHDRASWRFNDGGCDPAGRMLVASMRRDGEAAEGTLYRWADGEPAFEPLLTGLQIPNGFAWDADGRHVYFTDSVTRRIMVCACDGDAGLAEPAIWCETDPEWGVPDGMATDEEGGLWVAFWGGAAVRRFREGRPAGVCPLPVREVTSCAFGGAGLTTLFVTTARRRDVACAPGAGGVFAADAGVRGVPVHDFALAGSR